MIDRREGARPRSAHPTDFSDGVAVITGAASGIGAGLARRAVDRGMHVVLADVDKASVDAASAAFNADGADTVAEHVDVSDAEQVEALAQRVFDRWGRATLLVNNAGIELHGNTWEIPVDRWDRLVGVNLNAVFYGMHAFIPRMLGSGLASHVVNVASVAALRISPYTAPYAATKHGCLALTECVAKELAAVSDAIKVSAVLPGAVRTAIFETSFSADSDGPGAQGKERFAQNLARDGIDPVDAADIILTGAARGDLWIHTDPAVSRTLIDARAHDLQAQFT